MRQIDYLTRNVTGHYEKTTLKDKIEENHAIHMNFHSNVNEKLLDHSTNIASLILNTDTLSKDTIFNRDELMRQIDYLMTNVTGHYEKTTLKENIEENHAIHMKYQSNVNKCIGDVKLDMNGLKIPLQQQLIELNDKIMNERDDLQKQLDANSTYILNSHLKDLTDLVNNIKGMSDDNLTTFVMTLLSRISNIEQIISELLEPSHVADFFLDSDNKNPVGSNEVSV